MRALTKERFKTVRRILWILFAGICVFHFIYDGKSTGAMMRLVHEQGLPRDMALKKILWLCAPLNIAAFFVLVSILLVGCAEVILKRRGFKQD